MHTADVTSKCAVKMCRENLPCYCAVCVSVSHIAYHLPWVFVCLGCLPSALCAILLYYYQRNEYRSRTREQEQEQGVTARDVRGQRLLAPRSGSRLTNGAPRPRFDPTAYAVSAVGGGAHAGLMCTHSVEGNAHIIVIIRPQQTWLHSYPSFFLSACSSLLPLQLAQQERRAAAVVRNKGRRGTSAQVTSPP